MVWACAAAACATTGSATGSDESLGHTVQNIRLSNERGEVGRPFAAELSFDRNFEDAVEIEVTGLPPGLRFDDSRRAITGTPTEPGFFPVQLSVRKRVTRGRWHRPTADERWWSADVTLEIYRPVRD